MEAIEADMDARRDAPRDAQGEGLLDATPAPVRELDAEALEWGPLLALLGTYAASAVGRAGIGAFAPSRDRAWMERQHQLVEELRLLLNSGAAVRLGGLFDPTATVAKAQIPEAALEAEELLAVARLAQDAAAWQTLVQNPPAGAAIPALGSLGGVSGLADGLSLQPLAEAIERKFALGELVDDASPELARIRSAQLGQQRVIEESLRSALRRLSAQDQTQEELITIRGDRFVIPVKAEQKRRVSGVVHGASSSGQTVYLEPLETIEQNNELVRLLEEEQAEMHRIFVALTRLVAGHAEGLLAGARVLALVDTLQARARFAGDFDCCRPVFWTEESGPGMAMFRLEAARHPLLEKRLRGAGRGIVPFSRDGGRRSLHSFPTRRSSNT